MVTENKQMQVRRGTSSAWSSANPVNLDGEIGYDKTLNKLKVGDGATAWNTLPFLGGGIVVSRGAFASRPSSGTNVGDIYYCTDIGNEYRWNGSSWEVARGGNLTAFTPPPSAGWSAFNSGSVSATLDSRVITKTNASTDPFTGEIRTLSPASNYTATFYFDWAFPGLSFIRTGVILRNATSGNFIQFGAAHDSSSGGFNLWCSKWTNPTTFSAAYTLFAGPNLIGAAIPNWLRIRDDATSRFYEYSYNGVDWILDTSTTRTDFITADQIGWAVSANSTTAGTAVVRLRSFAGVS